MKSYNCFKTILFMEMYFFYLKDNHKSMLSKKGNVLILQKKKKEKNMLHVCKRVNYVKVYPIFTHEKKK